MPRPVRTILVGLALIPAAVAVMASSQDQTRRGGPPPSAREVRALWIVRDTLTTPAAIASVVEHAVTNGFNTLFVQVRGRGDAYFLGGLEPRAHVLAGQPPSFDPLQTTLDAARRAGLAVHAWVNVNLVASAQLLPASRDHVINRHPEWIMVPRPLAQELAHLAPQSPAYVGKLARWTRGQADDVEGLYLSPLVPAAATHTVAVVEDLVRRYAVDGIHLDYVRFPGPDFDYSRLALQEFDATVAATLESPQRHALARRAADDVLAFVDAYPDRWTAFRRTRLTALVVRLGQAVRAVRPNAVLSAAVFPDRAQALAVRLQDWQSWAENGLLDAICPMAYTADLTTFRRQIDEAVRVTPPALVWAGIGAYRLSPAQAVAHIEAARTVGASGVILFSYDTMVSKRTDAYLETVGRSAFGASLSGQDGQR